MSAAGAAAAVAAISVMNNSKEGFNLFGDSLMFPLKVFVFVLFLMAGIYILYKIIEH